MLYYTTPIGGAEVIFQDSSHSSRLMSPRHRRVRKIGFLKMGLCTSLIHNLTLTEPFKCHFDEKPVPYNLRRFRSACRVQICHVILGVELMTQTQYI
uniref:Uncharacterized protein n=1 Tax=Anguilla anguilla TaxID=7936 RepID=A0A0E9X634_ANGAN